MKHASSQGELEWMECYLVFSLLMKCGFGNSRWLCNFPPSQGPCWADLKEPLESWMLEIGYWKKMFSVRRKCVKTHYKHPTVDSLFPAFFSRQSLILIARKKTKFDPRHARAEKYVKNISNVKKILNKALKNEASLPSFFTACQNKKSWVHVNI